MSTRCGSSTESSSTIRRSERCTSNRTCRNGTPACRTTAPLSAILMLGSALMALLLLVAYAARHLRAHPRARAHDEDRLGTEELFAARDEDAARRDRRAYRRLQRDAGGDPATGRCAARGERRAAVAHPGARAGDRRAPPRAGRTENTEHHSRATRRRAQCRRGAASRRARAIEGRPAEADADPAIHSRHDERRGDRRRRQRHRHPLQPRRRRTCCISSSRTR